MGDGLGNRVRGSLEERVALMAPARRLRLSLAEERLAIEFGEREARVLDAGCGDGLLTLALARRHPHWNIVGIDLSEELLAGASARALNRGVENVDFRQADLTVELPDGGFDAVLALECLSEIPNDRAALRAMAGALGPGGLFVVQVPDRRWAPILPGSPPRWRAEVRHGYGIDQVEAMLREQGLRDIRVTPTYRTPVAAAQEVRDRIKDSNLVVRLMAFPFLAATVPLERMGVAWGSANALFSVGRNPRSDGR
jgi:SAM-dependent methyltransferase